MSVFEQYKNSGVLWVITALVLILVIALGILGYLAWGEADKVPPDSSQSVSAESSSQIAPSHPSVRPSSSKPSSSSQPAVPSASQSVGASGGFGQSNTSSYTAPPIIDITPGSVSTGTGKILLVTLPDVHDTAESIDKIVVSAHGALVANKIVMGDLVISSAVKNGWVILENILVKGNIILEGGGTVTLRNVTAAAMTAQRTDAGITAILLEGESTVQDLTVRHHVTIDEDALSPGFDGIRRVTTSPGRPLWQHVTLLDGTIDSLTSHVMTNVTVEKGGRVLLVNAKAQTHIEGVGIVSRLLVENDDVTYSLRPNNIDTEYGYYPPDERSNALGEEKPKTPSDDGLEIIPLNAPTGLAITDNASGDLIFSFTHDGTGVVGFRVICYVNGVIHDNTVLSSSVRSHTIGSLILAADDTVKFTARAESVKGADHHSVYAEKSAPVTRLAEPANLAVAAQNGNLTFSFDPVTSADAYELIPYRDGVALSPLIPTLTGSKMTATQAVSQAGSYHFTVRAVSTRILSSTSGIRQSDPLVLTKMASPTGTVTPSAGNIGVALNAQSGASGYTAWCNDTLMSPADSTGLLFNKAFSSAGNYIFTACALGNGTTLLDSDTAEIGRHTVTQIGAASNLSLSYSGGVITASFTGSAGAAGYTVDLTRNDVALALTQTGATTYTTAVALADNDRLALSVVANGDGISTLDANLSSTTRTVTQLSAPGNLTFASDALGKAVFGFSRVAGVSSYEVIYGAGGSTSTLFVSQSASGATISHVATFDADTVTSFKVKAIGSDFTLTSPDSATMTVVVLSVPSMTVTADKSGTVNNLHLVFTPESGVSYEVLPLTLIGSTRTTANALTPVGGKYSWSPTAVYDTGSGSVMLGFVVNATRIAAANTTYLSDSSDETLQLGTDLTAPLGLSVTASGASDTLFSFNPVKGASDYAVSYTTAGGTTVISTFFALNAGVYQATIAGVVPADVTAYSVTAIGNDYFPNKTTTWP